MTNDDVTPADTTLERSVLIEVSSHTGTARFPVRARSVTIGRSLDNDVVLDAERTVSRHHARFDLGDGGWIVRDLGSQNGTYVNGEAATTDDARAVGPGDIVGLGNVTVRLIDAAAGDSGTVVDPSGLDLHQLVTSLSTREREVLSLLAAGRTDDQIASELYISVKTVRSHLDRVRDKSGVRRRAELTRLAIRLGLTAGDDV